jgi:hypothetical protein
MGFSGVETSGNQNAKLLMQSLRDSHAHLAAQLMGHMKMQLSLPSIASGRIACRSTFPLFRFDRKRKRGCLVVFELEPMLDIGSNVGPRPSQIANLSFYNKITIFQKGSCCFGVPVRKRKFKKERTTAPRIPAWSPTMVLNRQHSG